MLFDRARRKAVKREGGCLGPVGQHGAPTIGREDLRAFGPTRYLLEADHGDLVFDAKARNKIEEGNKPFSFRDLALFRLAINLDGAVHDELVGRGHAEAAPAPRVERENDVPIAGSRLVCRQTFHAVTTCL